MTFATHLAASSRSECQIQNSTRNLYLLVVFQFKHSQKIPAEMGSECLNRTTSGVDLTFATHLAASSRSECQIQNSTRNLYLLVVFRFKHSQKIPAEMGSECLNRTTSVPASLVRRAIMAAAFTSPRPNSGLPEFGIIKWSKSDISDFDWGEVDFRATARKSGEGAFVTILKPKIDPHPNPPPQGGREQAAAIGKV